ncbi:MAG: hypothetical protein E3K37_00705 [Candidatus Kuenenia sp.]|nr:hypothetical protein [Candidatus Kuenenia hertensis]
MEQVLARARIYLIILVFFASCFLGLHSRVSLPTLAIRSILIAGITGIISHFFLKYLLSVFTTALQKENANGATEQSQIDGSEANSNNETNGDVGK